VSGGVILLTLAAMIALVFAILGREQSRTTRIRALEEDKVRLNEVVRQKDQEKMKFRLACKKPMR